MTRIIALTALAALGLSGAPVHEPVHGRGARSSCPATVRNSAPTTSARASSAVTSRRFYSPSLLADAGAADQRIRRSRPTPSIYMSVNAGIRAVHRADSHGHRPQNGLTGLPP